MGLSGLEPLFAYILIWFESTWTLPFICNVVGLSGLEPPTSRLSGVRSNRLSYKPIQVYDLGGDEGIRTPDPLLAGQVLSQLSYTPIFSGVYAFVRNEPSKLNSIRKTRYRPR